MLEGLRRTAKQIRRRYVFGTLFCLMCAGFAFVILRALASAAAYKDATVSILLDSANVTTFTAAEGDTDTHLIGFDVPSRRHRALPAVDFFVDMSANAHLLRPEENRPRTIGWVVRRGASMPPASESHLYVNGHLIGSCGLSRDVDQKTCQFSPDATLTPPADVWHVRLDDPRGGMFVNRVVIMIGR